MTDRDTFLKQIREQPADLTARLVYADYLRERLAEALRSAGISKL